MATLGKIFMCFVYTVAIAWQDFRDFVNEKYNELRETARDE